MFSEVIAQGFTPVIYLNPEVFKNVGEATRTKVLKSIEETKLKIYTPATAIHMKRCKKLYVYRYGILSDAVERFVRTKGGKVVSGLS